MHSMIDPMGQWSDMVKAHRSWARLGTDWISTMGASGQVLMHRLPMLAEAAVMPATANYDELCRLVPEKMDAYSRAALPWLSFWTRSILPTTATDGDILRAQRRVARTARRSLAPVKRTVRGNARRLSR